MRRISPVIALALCSASFAATQTVDHPLTVGGNVKPPKLMNRVYADAPKNSGHGPEHGEVTIAIVIDEKGHVVKADVVNSSGSPSFDKSALSTARSYLFRPATQDGTPVAVTMNVSMNFDTHQR